MIFIVHTFSFCIAVDSIFFLFNLNCFVANNDNINNKINGIGNFLTKIAFAFSFVLKHAYCIRLFVNGISYERHVYTILYAMAEVNYSPKL